MARTRQQAKRRQAERRKKQNEAQGTTGPKPPSNPGEQAVIQQAEAYEVADVIEESGGDAEEAAERLEAEPSDEAITPVEAPPPPEAPTPAEAPPARTQTKTRERKQRPADGGRDGRGGRGGRRGGGGRGEGARRRPERREPRQRGRLLNFFVQVWAELQRVQWPDRNQVTQATAVVVVFCLLAGLYLAFWDYLFSKLVKVIL